MTEQELEIMISVYGESKQLLEGKLFDYQKDALAQLQAGFSYWEKKYPGTTMPLLTFSPANPSTPWAQFLLQGPDSSTHKLTVTPSESGYICADNYYGTLIRESYDCKVAEILSTGGINAVTVTTFPQPMGIEICNSADDFISYEPKIARQTHIYTPEDSDQAQIELLLRKAGLYGTYIVYFVPDQQYGELSYMTENRTIWRKETFNCYDF